MQYFYTLIYILFAFLRHYIITTFICWMITQLYQRWLVSFTVKVSSVALNLCVCICIYVCRYLSVSFPGGLLMLNLISHATVTTAIRYHTHYGTHQHTHLQSLLASSPQLCNQAAHTQMLSAWSDDSHAHKLVLFY